MLKKIISLSLLFGLLCGCAPEVGSPEWCKKMKTKPNGDWTMNEAKDYASHCLFK